MTATPIRFARVEDAEAVQQIYAPVVRDTPISFELEVRARSWLKHLVDRKAAIVGKVTMEGFAARAPLEGEMTIDPLLGRLIRYEFAFRADDGKRYRFRGQKDIALGDLVGSWTTLPATIEDEGGRVVASAMLKFDAHDLPSFLGSFRPSL